MINDDSKHPDPIAEPFDQTNGMVEGLDGDSDGTAASDTHSAELRDSPQVSHPSDGSAALFQGHGQ
jgi:hypothetical protein